MQGSDEVQVAKRGRTNASERGREGRERVRQRSSNVDGLSAGRELTGDKGEGGGEEGRGKSERERVSGRS